MLALIAGAILAGEGGPGTVEVGVGPVVSDLDRTSETFGIYQCLARESLSRHAGWTPRIVASPYDAPVYVSGHVSGHVSAGVHPQPGWSALAGASVGIASGALLGLLGSYEANREPEDSDDALIAASALGGGVLIAALATRLTRRYHYQWSYQLAVDITGGESPEPRTFSTDGDARLREPWTAVRTTALEGSCRSLADELDRRVPAGGN